MAFSFNFYLYYIFKFQVNNTNSTFWVSTEITLKLNVGAASCRDMCALDRFVSR